MKNINSFIIFICIIFLTLSCVSSPPPIDNKDPDKPEESTTSYPEEKEYIGGGTSTSLAEAMLLAKVSAVQKGVEEIIGSTKEKITGRNWTRFFIVQNM